MVQWCDAPKKALTHVSIMCACVTCTETLPHIFVHFTRTNTIPKYARFRNITCACVVYTHITTLTNRYAKNVALSQTKLISSVHDECVQRGSCNLSGRWKISMRYFAFFCGVYIRQTNFHPISRKSRRTSLVGTG